MAEKSDYKWVRSLYGKDTIDANGDVVETAKQKYRHITEGGVNDIIKAWHEKQPEREYGIASPSRILTCPRAIWLQVNGVEPINGMGWGVKQRLMMGRIVEGQFAGQFYDEGVLLAHWEDTAKTKTNLLTKDDYHLEVPKMTIVTKDLLDQNEGIPDYFLQGDLTGGLVAVSDAKAPRSDGFGYVPISEQYIWHEWNFYKMRIQVTNYFMLAHENKDYLDKYKLPLPELCHLFSHALDDGVVRREMLWSPISEDMETVKKMTRRFNAAVAAKDCPPCTCKESYDEFDVKFCAYGIKEPGAKICESCCDDSLIAQANKMELK